MNCRPCRCVWPGSGANKKRDLHRMPPDNLPAAVISAFEAEVADESTRQTIIADIRAAYTAPGRHYHNLQHLGHLVRELESVRGSIAGWNLLMLAAAYHDVVYDTSRPDNEEASAVCAADGLRPFLGTARLQHLCDIILATKHHGHSPDSDTNLFCDADLAILGAAPDVYDGYARRIRLEYSRFPDELYHPGRTAVLSKLLEQPALFKTGVFQGRYESAARENIRREIASLSSGQ